MLNTLKKYIYIFVFTFFSLVIVFRVPNLYIFHIKFYHIFLINRVNTYQILFRSTITNLVSVTHFIANTMDHGGQTDIIYTDLSKAFDRLDHGLLLQKLSDFGLSLDFLSFFESYLVNRTLNVKYHGFSSIEVLATSGVPQGSVLGPLLFIIFINDICQDIQSNVLLYADDLKLFASINSEEDCHRLQHDLTKINSWCEINRLPLNISKCNAMTFTRRSNSINFSYKIGNDMVTRCKQFKDLGVIFDSKLTFTAHIDHITANAYRNLGFIMRNSRHFKDISTLSLLFNAFVRPKLEYGGIIWNPQYNVHTLNLEGVQRRHVKYLSLKADGIYPPRGTPQSDLLARFNLNDLATRRVYFSVLFLHKLLTSQTDCPDILSSIHFNVPSFQTRSYALFYLATPRTNVLKSSPVHNMCSNYLSYQSNLDIFNCNTNNIKQCILNRS